MKALAVPTIDAAMSYGYGDLAGTDDLYLSPTWLKIEQDLGLAPYLCYLLCLAKGEQPLAAAVKGFTVDEAAWWPFVRVDMVLARLLEQREAPTCDATKDLLSGLLPNIYFGSARGGTTKLRLHPALDDARARAAVAGLLAGAEDLARDLGLRSITFLYTDPQDTLLRELLVGSGYAEFGPTHHVAVLTVKGSSFADYLSGFGKRRRDSIRWERRKIAEAGVRIAVEELTEELGEQMRPLEAQLFKRYGHRDYPAQVMRYLHGSVARDYQGDTRVITARSEGVLRGYASFIQCEDVLYSRDTGYDYEWKKDLPLYFEVLFYSAIELAMRSGIREICYSVGSESTKASRGCDLYPRIGYVKALDPVTAAGIDRLCADLR